MKQRTEMMYITLERVLKWIGGGEPELIIRVGTLKGSGWLYRNYKAPLLLKELANNDLLNIEVVSMYTVTDRVLSTDDKYLEPGLCIIIEGNKNGKW